MSRGRLGGGLALGLALVALVIGLRPPAASAHAFLVSTDPAQGQRLEQPPSEILLRFSEPAKREAARVALRRHRGAAVPSGKLRQSDGGRQLGLPAAGPGRWGLRGLLGGALGRQRTRLIG